MKKNNQPLRSYILSFIKKYRVYFVGLFIVSILAAFFEIIVHYKIKEIIDVIASNSYTSLALLLMTFVLYKFLSHGMFFVAQLLHIRYKPKLNTELTEFLYKKTVGHSLHWFDSHMSGEIADKINSFQVSLNSLITDFFRFSLVFYEIAIGIIFLFRISYIPALVQLGFLVIYTPIVWFLLKKQLYLQQFYEKANQETTGIINDSISNIFGIKVVGNLVNEFKLKLTPALLKRQEWDRKTRIYDTFWVDNVDTLFTALFAAAQIYVLAYLYKNGLITAGGFAFIAMMMLKLHGDIETMLEKILFSINPQIAKVRASYEFANQEYDIMDRENAKELNNVNGSITFQNLYFAYPNSKTKVLDDFNLQIKAGEKIGLVGHSGAGKTTLIKSLIRYFDVQNGDILIDGVKIKDITQESLRQNISVIPQDITMFHRSILENLQIAKYDATKEEIIEACKKAKIHDDIMKMQDGYDSIVGERGIKVSGGQRQRIAIARAILKDAPILILDEATSSLDSQTEKQIQESVNLLIEDKSKTVIAIAHRLSTLKHMDRIIVLDKGKIVEEGTHDELIKDSNSLYKKLWEMQEI